MTEYTGTFSIANHTGKSITGATVEHSAANEGTVTIGPLDLADGQTSPQSRFKTESSSEDKWKLSFTFDGHLKTGNCSCGFERSDQDGNVTVSLHSTHYNIDMPHSSSCTDKSYNDC